MNSLTLTEQTQVTLIKNLDITDLGGEKVMIDFSTGKYFMLKGVANTIWEYLKEPITIGEIKNRLLSEYEVDETTCLHSVLDFILQLKKNDFVDLNDF